MFTALLALALVGQQPLDTRAIQALERLKQVFEAVGTPKPNLVKIGYPGGTDGVYAQVADADGYRHDCEITMTEAGRHISIGWDPMDELTNRYTAKPDPYKDPKLKKKAIGWVNKIAGRGATRLELMVINRKQKQGIAYFEDIKNGYPYFSDYGYTITLSYPEGRFIAMQARENPPPVDPHRPTVNQDAAYRIAKEWVAARYTEQGFRDSDTQKPRIGYLMHDGDRLPHLIWTVPIWIDPPKPDHPPVMTGGSGSAVGDAMITIDAVTGKILKTDGGFLRSEDRASGK